MAAGTGETGTFDGEGIMSDAIIVLNAGSSSLKFSIYGVADQDTGPCRTRTD